MFCPECGAEFKEGIATCDECEVALVADPPAEPQLEKYVDVLETSDLSAIPVIKTALEAAGIPFRTEGEGLMNLFPAETLGSPLHSSAGVVVFRVPEERAEEARAFLAEDAAVDGEAEDA